MFLMSASLSFKLIVYIFLFQHIISIVAVIKNDKNIKFPWRFGTKHLAQSSPQFMWSVSVIKNYDLLTPRYSSMKGEYLNCGQAWRSWSAKSLH